MKRKVGPTSHTPVSFRQVHLGVRKHFRKCIHQSRASMSVLQRCR